MDLEGPCWEIEALVKSYKLSLDNIIKSQCVETSKSGLPEHRDRSGNSSRKPGDSPICILTVAVTPTCTGDSVAKLLHTGQKHDVLTNT